MSPNPEETNKQKLTEEQKEIANSIPGKKEEKPASTPPKDTSRTSDSAEAKVQKLPPLTLEDEIKNEFGITLNEAKKLVGIARKVFYEENSEPE